MSPVKEITQNAVEQTPSSVPSLTIDTVQKKPQPKSQTRASELPQKLQSEPYFKPVSEFRATQRNLPHWQNPGSVYFVTFRTYKNLILDEISKQIIYDNICHYDGLKYLLYSFTVMDDHVHIILKPVEYEPNMFVSLSEIMKAIKGFASKQIKNHINEQTRASVLPVKNIFQAESFDRIIRTEIEFAGKMNYILNNAVKKGYCANGYDYKWFYLSAGKGISG